MWEVMNPKITNNWPLIIALSKQVHQDPDDLGQGTYTDSKTTGHAGNRIGCCVIKGTPPSILSLSLPLPSGKLCCVIKGTLSLSLPIPLGKLY